VKILFVAGKDDYGDPARGPSFEETNFHDTLKHMRDVEVMHYDFVGVMQAKGQGFMNEDLLRAYREARPDLVFFFLIEDEIHKETISTMSAAGNSVTFNWFADDHWRFDHYTRHWAPLFNWVSTTAASALPKYRRLRMANVIKTQWGFNNFSYRPTPSEPAHDITFVGQVHGDRQQTIEGLREANLRVETWGHGWESGRLEQKEMVRVFGTSRINLNLANSSIATPKVRPIRALQRLMGQDPWALTQQIKGRHFEIPGCGGFQLSSSVGHIEDYFVPDQEIALFDSPEEMADRAAFYLSHDDERRKIAAAGALRAEREHSYETRFRELFKAMSLGR
jgi:spore maturation protein CgeB